MATKVFINLTPHPFVVMNRIGDFVTFHTIPVEGGVLTARVDIKSTDITESDDEFAINTTKVGDLQFEVIDPETRKTVRILTMPEWWGVYKELLAKCDQLPPDFHFIVSMAVAPVMKRHNYNVVVGAKMLQKKVTSEDGTETILVYQTGFAIPD